MELLGSLGMGTGSVGCVERDEYVNLPERLRVLEAITSERFILLESQVAALTEKIEESGVSPAACDEDDESIQGEATEDDNNFGKADDYELEPSMWDAALLIGMQKLGSRGRGRCAATTSLLLILLNIVVQGLFALTVMTDSELGSLTTVAMDDSTIQSFRQWRTSIAHSLNYMDPLTQQSLASRVCAGDPGLELSGAQAAAYDTLTNYLQPHVLLGEPTGSVILMLCCFVWFMTVMTELGSAIGVIRTITGLRGQATTLSITDEGKIQMISLSTVRVAWFVGIQCFRILISLSLLVGGTQFLLKTTSVNELLLNVVALEFIMSLDEVIFTAFAPLRLKQMLINTEPVPQQVLAYRGLEASCFAKLGAVLLMTCILYPVLIAPQNLKLLEASDALCAGNLDFVYTRSALGQTVWSFTSPHHDPPDFRPWQHWPKEEFANQQASKLPTSGAILLDEVLARRKEEICNTGCLNETIAAAGSDSHPIRTQARWGLPYCCYAEENKLPVAVGGGYLSVSAFASRKIDEGGEFIDCLDFLDMRYPAFVKYFTTFADPASDGTCPLGCTDPYHPLCKKGECVTPSCADALPFCTQDSVIGTRARVLCPTTCGCNDPTSAVALTLGGAIYGCPVSCQASLAYRSKLKTSQCEDAQVGSTELIEYSNSWADVTVSNNWTAFHVAYSQVFAGMLNSTGCQHYVDFMYKGYFPWLQQDPFMLHLLACGSSDYAVGPFYHPLSPLHTICPVACGCKSGDRPDRLCPETCNATR